MIYRHRGNHECAKRGERSLVNFLHFGRWLAFTLLLDWKSMAFDGDV